ncbi:hypothetical protein D6445_24140 [Salmonella enterica subsp. enterica serovar Infantis]|nr:hypothetical protein [Salmonella enterica subsp. enterica serovar Infantis]
MNRLHYEFNVILEDGHFISTLSVEYIIMMDNLITVALEGPSFAGKTTLLKYCKSIDSLTTVPEYYDINNKESLAGRTPIRDELGQMETFFKLMRMECQRQRVIHDSMEKNIKSIQDRSFFSLISYEYARYGFRNTWKQLDQMMSVCDFIVPQLIIYIDTSPKLVEKRGTCNGVRIDHPILNEDFIIRNKKYFEEYVSDITTVKICSFDEANKFIKEWTSSSKNEKTNANYDKH